MKQKEEEEETRINEPVLKLENVSFKYKKGEKRVLEKINLEVWSKGLQIIVGPNGSGKTTLIKQLNGLLSPQEGTIFLDGKKATPSSLMKAVGVVFQNPDEQVFFPRVKEDLLFGPLNRGMSPAEAETEIKKIARFLGITSLLNRKFFELSFGEKKKVAIAGVLAFKPKVLVLDEPTIGLDPWIKPKFLEMLIQLKEEQPVIVATHDLDLIAIADQVIYLRDGKIRGIYKTAQEFLEDTEMQVKIIVSPSETENG